MLSGEDVLYFNQCFGCHTSRDLSMVVIDWLQTCEFVRENSELFLLYFICGCLFGLSILLGSIIVLLYIDRRSSLQGDCEYDHPPSYIPVYHYNDRTPQHLYGV